MRAVSLTVDRVNTLLKRALFFHQIHFGFMEAIIRPVLMTQGILVPSRLPLLKQKPSWFMPSPHYWNSYAQQPS